MPDDFSTAIQAFDAVFSDFDGVLFDTEPIHFRAFRETLASANVALSERAYFETYCHGDNRQIITHVLADNGINDAALIESLCDMKEKVGLKLLREAQPVAGAVAFIRRAAAEGKFVAIVSSAERSEIDVCIDGADWADCVSFIVSSDIVENVKPHPEPYLTALRVASERVGKPLRADRCLAVEDTAGGVRAGRGAGLTVWATGNTQPPRELLAAGAARFIPDFNAIL